MGTFHEPCMHHWISGCRWCQPSILMDVDNQCTVPYQRYDLVLPPSILAHLVP